MYSMVWKKAWWIRLGLYATFFLVFGYQNTGAGEYLWPLAAPPALTSTFGEYRPGRFHAGLDIKTWGREGYPILAVDDGYVWRVRTSPWGYGRAVYFRLRDGNTVVYAHLSGFSDEIQKIVSAEQIRHGKYSVNLFLNPKQVNATKGDTLGYSGSTGIGFPHLHFEFRDSSGRAANPLQHGFKVQDTLPPTIQAVALIPLDADSRVGGETRPITTAVKWEPKRKRFLVPGSISIEGRVGVAVKVYDRADGSQFANRLAPFRIKLYVDGNEAYETTYTRLAYNADWRMDEMGQVELDRNFVLKARGDGIFHNLYRETGNRLSLHGSYRPGDGVLHSARRRSGSGIALPVGFHVLRIDTEDAFGNRSSAEIKVLANEAPRVEGASAEIIGDSVYVSATVPSVIGDSIQVTIAGSRDMGGSWEALGKVFRTDGKPFRKAVFKHHGLYRITARNAFGQSAFQTCSPPVAIDSSVSEGLLFFTEETYADFSVLQIRSDRILVRSPEVRADSREWEQVLSVSQTGMTSYETVLKASKQTARGLDVYVDAVGTDGRATHQLLKMHQQEVLTTGGAVTSADGMAAIHFDTSNVYRRLYCRAQSLEISGPTGLPAVGHAYAFLPDNVPFHGKVNLSLRYPAGFDRPQRLGVYMQKADSTWSFMDNTLDIGAGTVSARISYFSTFAILLDEIPPELGSLEPQGVITESRPELTAKLSDNGSGIGREEDIEVRLDGKAVIFELDPEEERLSVTLDRPLKDGIHSFTVSAKDMCGNVSRAESQFTVRRGQIR